MADQLNPLGGGVPTTAPGSSCVCVKLNGSQCGKPTANGSDVCSLHARVMERRAEKKRIYDEQIVNARVLRQAILIDPTSMDPAVVYDFLALKVEETQITRAQSIALFRRFMDAHARALNLMRAPFPAPPKTELQAFVTDKQNVHRKVITDNTNDTTDKLLAVPVPVEQDTLAEIQGLFGKSKKVMRDVLAWYKITMCRTEADCLYKRTLDGLWATIKASPHKDELGKRLVEELTEAVGMCCEGHLSRLCNVLVGFDDAFTSVVSKGEILQQKMADIAKLEITERAKKMRARKVLRELEIPVADHAVWLDAF